MDPKTKHNIVDYGSRAVVSAAIVAGVVHFMHGDRHATMMAAVGGAIAGLASKPVSDYLSEALTNMQTVTVPAAADKKAP
jgi:hypothetical protein